MPTTVVNLIITYGYWAIFCLVLLQGMGIPGVPNELALLYFGYLAHTKVISLVGILLAAISADMVGTSFLYVIFYFFGTKISSWKPHKLLNLRSKLHAVKASTASNGSMLLTRLTPFVRGYSSVIAGLLQIDVKKYAQIVAVSAVIWNSFFIVLGYLIAIRFAGFIQTLPEIPVKGSVYFLLLILFSIFLYKIVQKYFHIKSSTKTSVL